MHGGPHAHGHPAPRAVLVTLALGLVLVAAKVWAYAATGFSAAVLASLLDSVVDIAVSAMNGAAILYAHRPPDADHRHGHGKAEGVAALAQAALMAGAGAFLAAEAVGRLLAPPPVAVPLLAAGLVLGSTLVTVAILWVQRRAVAQAPSLALEADSAHYTADLALNGGVVATLVAAWAGAPAWVDGAFGLAVAAWVGWTAWGVAGQALDMLLDAELDAATRGRIEAIALAHPAVRGLHDLRTRRAGAREAVSLDLELEPRLTLAAAHAIG
ncbi:MAG TPA: hypothetical protein DDX54_02915, partial [Rhodospirillaceae bacterium]|nr:hypothetical protein [Rhodospirillaceae bacterium]